MATILAEKQKSRSIFKNIFSVKQMCFFNSILIELSIKVPINKGSVLAMANDSPLVKKKS